MSRPLGLGALLRGDGNVVDGMSLPKAMRLLKAGLIESPQLGGIDVLTSAPLRPVKPQPAKPLPYQHELDEQRAQDRLDRQEMRGWLRAKRNSNAPGRWDELEMQLNQMESKNA